jgi:hypothetical protein
MEPTKAMLGQISGQSFTECLRTRRVQIAVPVLVRGREGNRSIEEETYSVSVNAYGGILRLSAQVVLAQRLLIINPATAIEVSGIVTFVGPESTGKRDVCIEFSEPSVSFWGISFPGWSLSDRKSRTHEP